jgi:hypothetical protein
MRNSHSLSREKPHILNTTFRWMYIVSLWISSTGRLSLEQYFLSYRMNCKSSWKVFPSRLVTEYGYSMTMCHLCRQVMKFLNHHFHNRWIDRGGAETCPPRSPDLSTLDCAQWGPMNCHSTQERSQELVMLVEPLLAYETTPRLFKETSVLF